MKPILQNLVEMTGQRDHLRLEVSVLSTLQWLPHVVQARALEIFMLQGVRHVRPRTWMHNGLWQSTETEAASDPLRQPLAQFPALHDCIQTHSLQARATSIKITKACSTTANAMRLRACSTERRLTSSFPAIPSPCWHLELLSSPAPCVCMRAAARQKPPCSSGLQ